MLIQSWELRCLNGEENELCVTTHTGNIPS